MSKPICKLHPRYKAKGKAHSYCPDCWVGWLKKPKQKGRTFSAEEVLLLVDEAIRGRELYKLVQGMKIDHLEELMSGMTGLMRIYDEQVDLANEFIVALQKRVAIADDPQKCMKDVNRILSAKMRDQGKKPLKGNGV